MDDRSIKRLGVIVVTAIVLILMFKSVGLKIANRVGQEHQKALATRREPPAPPAAAAPESAPLATPEPAPAPSALPDAGVDAAPGTAAASGVR